MSTAGLDSKRARAIPRTFLFPKTLSLLGVVLLLLAIPILGKGPAALSLTLPFVPPSVDGGDSSFSFVVYGDIQDNYRNGHDALVTQMLREPTDLVFNAGDISPDDGKHYGRDVYPVVEGLARRVPFLPALGNHDIEWGDPCSRCRFAAFFSQTFDYLAGKPGNGHLQEPGSQKLWYSLVHRGVQFIVLDSNLFIDEGRYRRTHALEPYRNYRQEQAAWLDNLLEESSLNAEIRARFVFFHHSPFFSHETNPVPIFGVGGHPGHRRMVVNQVLSSSQSEESLYLLDAFRKHKVTAVFTGHEHYYERWREIIRQEGRPIHAVNWVVTGMGGVKPRGTPEYEEEEIRELLEEEATYRDYLARISDLDSRWTAQLRHAYPTEKRHGARFHNYVLVTVHGSLGVSFQTKDGLGRVRDEGSFSLTPDELRSPALESNRAGLLRHEPIK